MIGIKIRVSFARERLEVLACSSYLILLKFEKFGNFAKIVKKWMNFIKFKLNRYKEEIN